VNLDSTVIEDTFAEAFPMRYTRLLVTAGDSRWLEAGLAEFTGFSSSVIACDAEIGVESIGGSLQTPDGRTGASVLVFGFSHDALAKAVPNRTGQCLMTCPTTAVFDGLSESDQRIALGKHIRFFGDGYQKSKVIEGERLWRIPVMDGEFVVTESVGVEKGIGGGNLIIQAGRAEDALEAARRAVEAIAAVPGVMTPFPGGVVRSGSKVGSRYSALPASTADAFCPTLRGRVESRLHPQAQAAYEVVIDGVDRTAIETAMAVALSAASGPNTVAISAGNYGGKLGKHHFHLHSLIA